MGQNVAHLINMLAKNGHYIRKIKKVNKLLGNVSYNGKEYI